MFMGHAYRNGGVLTIEPTMTTIAFVASPGLAGITAANFSPVNDGSNNLALQYTGAVGSNIRFNVKADVIIGNI